MRINFIEIFKILRGPARVDAEIFPVMGESPTIGPSYKIMDWTFKTDVL